MHQLLLSDKLVFHAPMQQYVLTGNVATYPTHQFYYHVVIYCMVCL